MLDNLLCFLSLKLVSLSTFPFRNAHRCTEERILHNVTFHAKHMTDELCIDNILWLSLSKDRFIFNRYEMMRIAAC
ncbi:hypothetical protein D3C86_1890250 [compost metagenome]